MTSGSTTSAKPHQVRRQGAGIPSRCQCWGRLGALGSGVGWAAARLALGGAGWKPDRSGSGPTWNLEIFQCQLQGGRFGCRASPATLTFGERWPLWTALALSPGAREALSCQCPVAQ